MKLVVVAIIVLRLVTLGWGEKVSVDDEILEHEFILRISPQVKFDIYRNNEYQWVWFEYNTDRIGVKVDRWPEINLGDRLRVRGQPKSLHEENYFIWRKTVWVLDSPQVQVVNGTGGWRYMNNVRQRFLRVYKRSLTVTSSSVLSAMVIGEKRGLSEDFDNKLRWSGLSHVVVVSGFNIMLIFTYFSLILRKLVGWKSSIIGGMILVWVFVFLVGFEAPVLRAAVFLSVISLGDLFGRVVDVRRVFWVTVSIMLVVDPLSLFDVSWQLSVAAMGGLVWLPDKFDFLLENRAVLQRVNEQLQNFLSLKEILVSTFSASLAVLPILVWHFGTISLTTLISNVAVVWLVPVITVCGLVLGLIGFLSQSVAVVLLQLLQAPLYYFQLVVNVLGQSYFSPELGTWAKLAVVAVWIYVVRRLFGYRTMEVEI